MHRTSIRRRPIGVALFGLALWLGFAGAAGAQEVVPGPQSPRQIVVPRGGTISIQMGSRKPISAVDLDVPGIVRAVVAPADIKTVLITGETPGLARLTLTDKDGGKEAYELIVQTDVEYLKFVLRRAVPTANIDPVPSANNAFVLTGTVQRAEDVAIVLATAQSIIGNNIINALRVGGVMQVQLDVVVALVDRSRARNMGFSWIENGVHQFLSSTIGGGGTLTNMLGTSAANTTANLTGTPNIIFGLISPSHSFSGYLNALITVGVAKTLAEPKVVTLSGKPAQFVSGGEQAVPTLASGSAGGGAVSGIDFRPFGTTVRVLPIVLGDGKIYLDVEPQVTFPSGNAAIAAPVAGTTGTVAGRTTQRLQTSIIIEDGQTFAIGGLIQKTSNVQVTKVPILGDLPYIGAGFRVVSDTEDEQELLILVTPHLVDPLACSQLPKLLPTQETRRPDDFELFLEGILEAPRGPREVWQNFHYVPAFRNAASLYPCAGGACGLGGCGLGSQGCGGCGYGQCGAGGCANGQCGVGAGQLGQPGGAYTPTLPPMPQVSPATFQERTDSRGIPLSQGSSPMSPVPPVPAAPVPVTTTFPNRASGESR